MVSFLHRISRRIRNLRFQPRPLFGRQLVRIKATVQLSQRRKSSFRGRFQFGLQCGGNCARRQRRQLTSYRIPRRLDGFDGGIVNDTPQQCPHTGISESCVLAEKFGDSLTHKLLNALF